MAFVNDHGLEERVRFEHTGESEEAAESPPAPAEQNTLDEAPAHLRLGTFRQTCDRQHPFFFCKEPRFGSARSVWEDEVAVDRDWNS